MCACEGERVLGKGEAITIIVDVVTDSTRLEDMHCDGEMVLYAHLSTIYGYMFIWRSVSTARGTNCSWE